MSTSNYHTDAEGTSLDSSMDMQDETACPTSRRKRSRTVFTTEAIALMEEQFERNKYPDIHRRESMAEEIGVPEARLQVWFQNRRARINNQKSRSQKTSVSDDGEGQTHKEAPSSKRRHISNEKRSPEIMAALRAKASTRRPNATSSESEALFAHQYDHFLSCIRNPYLALAQFGQIPAPFDFYHQPNAWLPGVFGNSGSDISKTTETDGDIVERLFRFSSPSYQKGRPTSQENRSKMMFPPGYSSMNSAMNFPATGGFSHDPLLMRAPRMSDARETLATDLSRSASFDN